MCPDAGTGGHYGTPFRGGPCVPPVTGSIARRSAAEAIPAARQAVAQLARSRSVLRGAERDRAGAAACGGRGGPWLGGRTTPRTGRSCAGSSWTPSPCARNARRSAGSCPPATSIIASQCRRAAIPSRRSTAWPASAHLATARRPRAGQRPARRGQPSHGAGAIPMDRRSTRGTLGTTRLIGNVDQIAQG